MSMCQRQRSLGSCRSGGSASSDNARYHSAQAVCSLSAKYSPRTVSPRCQRPSLGGSARNSGSPPWGVWRHQIRSTAMRRRSLCRRRLFQRRDDLRNATVLAPANDLQRLVVVKRGDGLAQPDRDIAGIHHAGQALDQRRQLNEPLGPRSRRRTGADQPRTGRAGGSTCRASDVRVPELADLIDEGGFASERRGGCRRRAMSSMQRRSN